jgi:hypothetical protein
MWTDPKDLEPRASRNAKPTRVAPRRSRTSIGPSARRRLVPAVLVLAVVGSMVAGASVRAQSADEDTASEPGMCLEAAASLVDPGAWNEILDAVTVAADLDTDFFPDASALAFPDLTQPWDPGTVPTVKIGIWGTGAGDPGSTNEGSGRRAATDCLRDGSEWTTTISHDLVLAAAERILAGARLPQPDGELLISEDVEADIDVEFHPDEQRVHTILDWSKSVIGPLRVGGLCWIDDVLGADAGEVVVRSEADMAGGIGAEAGCALFQEFLDETGAGERAVDLLPTEIFLADGTVVRFFVESVEVHDAEIVMMGSIETR